MESALPYRIPGPAGDSSTQLQNSYSSPQKPVLDLCRTAPWRQMLAHLNRKIPSSIALLRRNALSNDHVKLNSLPVLIDSLAYVGKDASVLLRDPTGFVRGTIHAEVFKERKGMLEQGVVILLNHVSALAYIEERRGFRGSDDIVHLSVQACHVSEVFKGSNTIPTIPSSFSLLDDYEFTARSPQPIARAPVARLPLRERNFSRPVFRVAQANPRGGGTVGGTGQPWLQPKQWQPPLHRRMHQRHSKTGSQQLQDQHSSNQAPHYRTMSHNRSAHRSNQHERPFRPPAKRSYVTEEGILPAQKRPNVRSTQLANRQPQQQFRTVAAITDDQLDSLLGDLDVDAMIAAHGKSTSLLQQSGSSIVEKQALVNGKSATLSPDSNKQQQERLKAPACSTLTEKTSCFEAKSRVSGGTKTTDDTVTKGRGAIDIRNVQVSAPANTPRSQKSQYVIDKTTHTAHAVSSHRVHECTISNVDQDMVNNLFDGIDAAEFM